MTGKLLATMRMVSPTEWITYTSYGYWTGSDGAADIVERHFDQHGAIYGADLRPDTAKPNPEKVAEALREDPLPTSPTPPVSPGPITLSSPAPKRLRKPMKPPARLTSGAADSEKRRRT